MMRTSIVLGLGLALAAAPAIADQTDIALFGKDPGDQPAQACFIRHYDQPHLKVHPEQNVTDMLMFVDSTVDAEYGRGYSLSLGVNFRGVEHQMQVSGGCGATDVEGDGLLGCGIDCDGGWIGVRVKDANAMYVEIPDGARIWDPDPSVEEPPAEAAFGKDDLLFRLDRTDLSECLPVIYDEDLKAQIVAAK